MVGRAGDGCCACEPSWIANPFTVLLSVPTSTSYEIDEANDADFDLSFVENKYIQPEIQVKTIIPDLDDDKLHALGFEKSEATDHEEVSA